MKPSYLLKTLLTTFFIFNTFNANAAGNQIVLAANNPTAVTQTATLSAISNINLDSAKIAWLDNYLESILVELSIKKIDLQMSILDAYEKDTSKSKSLFLSEHSEFSNVSALKDYKVNLQQKLTALKSKLFGDDYVNNHNDFDTNKLLKSADFRLKDDKSELIAFIKNYQQILQTNQQTIKHLEQEIHQGRRSEFDMHFTVLNELENQIFLKKAVKLYLIEKLKQQPTSANLEEINYYLLSPIDIGFLR